MTVGAHSYGSANGVASLVPRYADNGTFTAASRPTLQQAETWINQTSAIVNSLLAESGFATPVTQADAVLLLAGLVESVVAEYAEYANRAGRFWSDGAQDRMISVYKVLHSEISSWINQYAKGIENMGASRTAESGSEIVFRDTDEAGDLVPPLFQRKDFGDVKVDSDT